MQSFHSRRSLVEYDFPLVNVCWLLIAFLYFVFLEIVPRITWTITFPGIEISLTSLWFCRSLCFFKVEVTFSFPQMLDTSLSFYDNSDIESGLAYLFLMKNTSISSTWHFIMSFISSVWEISILISINPYRIEILSCPLNQLFLMLNNEPNKILFPQICKVYIL